MVFFKQINNPSFSKKRSLNNFFKPCNNFFKGSLVQAKLSTNKPGDIYEHEADAVAEKVMRMSVTETSTTFFKPYPLALTPIQRKCSHCEVEDKLQMKGEGDATAVTTAPFIVHDVISSGGHPLDAGTRNFMESRFGYDFSDVQIHNDSLAHQSSADINALAYAHGNHVVFGAGQYQPNTDAGKQLLAHELTHVVQQHSNNFRAIQNAPDDTGDKYKRRPPGKGAYTEADLDAWERKHPKYELTRGGPEQPDFLYNRYMPQWFWQKGYFYAGSEYAGVQGGYFEIWLSNKGNGSMFRVLRVDLSPTSGKQTSGNTKNTPVPPQVSVPAGNPAMLDLGGDFEKMFGEEIRSQDDTNVMGAHGYATEYADGTIVFFDDDGQMTIYKPMADAPNENEYEVYDDDGEKTENVVIGLDPDNIFY